MKDWDYVDKLILIRNVPGTDAVLAKGNVQDALNSENASYLFMICFYMHKMH